MAFWTVRVPLVEAAVGSPGATMTLSPAVIAVVIVPVPASVP